MRAKKTTRVVLWSLVIVAAVFFGPLFLFMASNMGAAILNLVLNRKPTSNELVGTYKLQVPWGRVGLRIDADGTFQEEINEGGKPVRRLSGHWQSREGSNFLDVEFRPFGMVWDDDHDRETNIYGINFYKRLRGTTYGVINDDLGEQFERQR